jgi:uncharacterized protein (TIGR03083 family)
MELVGADDVRVAGELATATLHPLTESADWSVPAGELQWTCRRTLDHLCDCLLYYSGQLARRADRQGPVLRDGDADASIRTLVAVARSGAAVLAAVADGTPPDARAYHPAGMSDRSGYCAMGIDEILVHTADIARGLGAPFEPPAELCEAVVARLFPWAPDEGDPWAVLQWANGRHALPGHERQEPNWYWHCAPLDEWDGTPTRRTRPPRWT